MTFTLNVFSVLLKRQEKDVGRNTVPLKYSFTKTQIDLPQTSLLLNNLPPWLILYYITFFKMLFNSVYNTLVLHTH